MSNFIKYRLGDECRVINGRAYKQEELLEAGKYRVLRVGNFFSNGSWYYSDLELDEDKYCQNGDLLFAWSASFGPKIWKEDKTIYHYHIWKLQENDQRLNKIFLYYYLKNITQSMLGSTHGSIMLHLTKAYIEDLVINVPKNVKEQNLIASVLSALDSKIELNNRINAELEAMAKTIYDYWFVQFEFPVVSTSSTTEKKVPVPEPVEGTGYKSSGGKMVWNEELKREIPEGWEVKKFGEVVTIKNGKDHKHLNSGSYPVYGSGGVMRHVDEFLYDSESILIPRKGSLGNLFYINQPFWSVDTIFYTQMKFAQSCKYLFYTTQNFNISAMNTGTSVPSMTAGILNNLSLVFPSSDILKLFDEILQPIFKKKDILLKENQQLASLRDWLLPMLMNGQVKVN